MDIYKSYRAARGIDYIPSQHSAIENYILAKVQMKQSNERRIIISPDDLDNFVQGTAADILGIVQRTFKT